MGIFHLIGDYEENEIVGFAGVKQPMKSAFRLIKAIPCLDRIFIVAAIHDAFARSYDEEFVHVWMRVLRTIVVTWKYAGHLDVKRMHRVAVFA